MHLKTNSGTKKIIALTALGTTSTLAIIASSTVAQAGSAHLYGGISAGVAFGEVPTLGGGTASDYGLSGSVFGGFVGVKKTLDSGMMIGLEVALSGKTEGDPNGNASYDYGYDINSTIDTKLRVGTNIGKVTVYGFAGLTVGNANSYSKGYAFSGVNFGAGAEMAINDNMFVGIEAIDRSVSGYNRSASSNSHGAVSMRAGFNF